MIIVWSKLEGHPHILKCYLTESDGVVVIDEYSGPAVYLLNEYWVNSSLSKMLIRTGPFEERITRFYFIQLLSAVWYMHKLRIAHLDIKPDNILFDEFFNIKFSDFGTSILLLDTDWTSSRRWGTRGFMAPEVDKTTQLTPYNVFKADIYSLGVTLMILTGNLKIMLSSILF